MTPGIPDIGRPLPDHADLDLDIQASFALMGYLDAKRISPERQAEIRAKHQEWQAAAERQQHQQAERPQLASVTTMSGTAMTGADRIAAARRQAIDSRKYQLSIEAEARAELAAEQAPPSPVAAISGADFLAQPDEDVAWRIRGLWPAGGNVVLAAQYKAGKTTLRDNLIAAWCDDRDFLGMFPIEPPAQPLLVIDAEMSAATARRWIRAHNITRPDRFRIVSIRGTAGSMNLLTAAGRHRWAQLAAGCSAILLDCLGPVLGALGLDENKPADVSAFLAGYEQMLAESGVAESLVVHHMGHGGERTRGASRLRDWPDAEWSLIRQDDNPASPRYFRAFGRDVDVPETGLLYDTATRLLSVVGGSRKDDALAAAKTSIADYLTATPGAGSNQIHEALDDDQGRNNVRAALAAMRAAKDVTVEPGPNRAKLHYLSAPVRRSAPPVGGAPSASGAPPYRGGALAHPFAQVECANQSGAPETATAVLGPCQRCSAPCDRYGPTGNPLCSKCRDEETSRP